MWGIEGRLFIHTVFEVAMWDGSDFSVLGYWPGSRDAAGECSGGIALLRLRATSATDVFLAAGGLGPGGFSRDPYAGEHTCVEHPLVLYWDGSLFHWL